MSGWMDFYFASKIIGGAIGLLIVIAIGLYTLYDKCFNKYPWQKKSK